MALRLVPKHIALRYARDSRRAHIKVSASSIYTVQLSGLVLMGVCLDASENGAAASRLVLRALPLPVRLSLVVLCDADTARVL